MENYKIVEVDTDNIELYELKETKTASDKSTFEVWERVKSYGAETATEELAGIDKQIEELNPTKASEKVIALEAKKVILNEIEELRTAQVKKEPIKEIIK
jgi:hypothetical protein